jgi:hypothetical protein
LNAAATAIESSGKVVGDFEASGAVSTHAALTTGIHGVGTGTIATTTQALTMLVYAFDSNVTFGSTRYYAISGASNSTTEATVQVRNGKAGTLKRLRVRVYENGLDAATVFTVRKNGVDTAVTFTVGAGATGTFTDDVNTVAVALDDLLDYSIVVAGSTGLLSIKVMQCEIA